MIETHPVLLVDDEPSVLKALQRTLAGQPWVVVTAEGGKAGLEMIETSEFSAVVSDYRMPDIDGIALLTRVRQRWPQTERILLSAHMDQEALERGINNASLMRVLHKPWDPDVLVGALATAIEHNRIRRENVVLLEQLRQRNDELTYLNDLLNERVNSRDQSLLAFRRRWDVALNAIEEPIIVVTAARRIEGGNSAAAKLAGVPSAQLEGRLCHEALFDSAKPCAPCPLANGPCRPETGTNDGRLFEARAYPLPGDPAAFLCSYHDITALVAFQRESAHIEKMAALGRLASGVAHEINNPLHTIMTFTQLAQRPAVVQEKLDRYHEIIRESALRCRDIVDSIRGFAHRDSAADMGSVDLGDVCSRALVLYEVTNHVCIERVWEADHGALCRGRANELQQVVINLVQNAADVSPQGGKIRVGLTVDGPTVRLRVEDQGPGVAVADLDRIFEPFFTTKAEGIGTGLGLAISDRIVREHGGTIAVLPSELGGACFEVRLPCSVPQPDEQEGHDA